MKTRLGRAGLAILAGIAICGLAIVVGGALHWALGGSAAGVRIVDKAISGGMLGGLMVVAIGVGRALFGKLPEPEPEYPSNPVSTFSSLPRVKGGETS